MRFSQLLGFIIALRVNNANQNSMFLVSETSFFAKNANRAIISNQKTSAEVDSPIIPFVTRNKKLKTEFDVFSL